MTVVVLSACPVGLRGQLTRWLLEIAPGVFVGFVSARVRDLMWERVVELVGRGRALMVFSVRGEQRLAFKVHGHEWVPVDYEGVQLMLRPAAGGATRGEPGSTEPGGVEFQRSAAPQGWSTASRRRRFRSGRRSEEA